MNGIEIFKSKLFEICNLYHREFCLRNRIFNIEPRLHDIKRFSHMETQSRSLKIT